MFGFTEAIADLKEYIKKRTSNNKIVISYGAENAVVLYTNHISVIKSRGNATNICMDNGDVYQTSYSLSEIEDVLEGKVAAGNNKLYATPRQTAPAPVKEKLTVKD